MTATSLKIPPQLKQRIKDVTEVFDYFEARSGGASVRKPRLKSWRKSA